MFWFFCKFVKIDLNYFMKTNNSKLSNYILYASIAFVLLCAAGFIYSLKSKNNTLTTEVKTITDEKAVLLNDLNILKANYDLIVVSDQKLQEELNAEKVKVADLIYKLENDKNSVVPNEVYKKQYLGLNSKMKDLILQIDNLKKVNESLLTERDCTYSALNNSKQAIDTLKNQNSKLLKKIVTASKLNVVNLQTYAVKVSSSGKTTLTDKASKANFLNVNFVILENSIAKSCEKKYYIQIIDSNNNVLGDKKSEKFGKDELFYSFIKNVTYTNMTVEVVEKFAVQKLEKGNYTVIVYDEGKMVAKYNFDLL